MDIICHDSVCVRDEVYEAYDGLISNLVRAYGSTSSTIEVLNGPATHTRIGCCNDGSNNSIASPELVQSALITSIGLMEPAAPVGIQIALKDSEE